MHSMSWSVESMNFGCSQPRFSSSSSLVKVGKNFSASKNGPSCSTMRWMVVLPSWIWADMGHSSGAEFGPGGDPSTGAGGAARRCAQPSPPADRWAIAYDLAAYSAPPSPGAPRAPGGGGRSHMIMQRCNKRALPPPGGGRSTAFAKRRPSGGGDSLTQGSVFVASPPTPSLRSGANLTYVDFERSQPRRACKQQALSLWSCCHPHPTAFASRRQSTSPLQGEGKRACCTAELPSA